MTVATPDLAAALIAAQSEFDTVSKDAMNPHFGKTYATLKSAVDMAGPILARNGLAVTQTFGVAESGDTLTTTLLHQSGQSIEGTMRLHLDKVSSQGLGSASTYARRYGYMAILGLVADDDDGNTAEVYAPQQQRQQAPPPQQQRPPQQQQAPQQQPQQSGTASRVAQAAGRSQQAPQQQRQGQDPGESQEPRQGKYLFKLFKTAEDQLGWDRARYTQEIALFGDGVTDDRNLTRMQADALIANLQTILGLDSQGNPIQQQPQYQEPPQQYAYDDNEPF